MRRQIQDDSETMPTPSHQDDAAFRTVYLNDRPSNERIRYVARADGSWVSGPGDPRRAASRPSPRLPAAGPSISTLTVTRFRRPSTRSRRFCRAHCSSSSPWWPTATSSSSPSSRWAAPPRPTPEGPQIEPVHAQSLASNPVMRSRARVPAVQMFAPQNPESNKFTTAGPLFLVYVVTCIKQAVEDWKRYRADCDMNGKDAHVRARVPLPTSPMGRFSSLAATRSASPRPVGWRRCPGAPSRRGTRCW